MNRRRFAFWIGFTLFWIAERVRAAFLDDLGAAIMDATAPRSVKTPRKTAPTADKKPGSIRWKTNEDEKWKWFERFERKDSVWIRTGTTKPINKETGDYRETKKKYLEESAVPLKLRFAQAKADPERRARHGRPPSKWLRRLNAGEIRLWLKTIDVPEADVAGMTFWTHLTRDHSFDAVKIKGLNIDEQAKLHAAAHHGY